jgi:predicted nucleotide-binding protein
MYYHARVMLKPKSVKSIPIPAFELDLTREDLLRSIAVPFLRQERFYCGGTVVEAGTVQSMNFNETSQPSSELLPFIMAERARSGLISVREPKSEVTFKGKDVTRDILDQASKEVVPQNAPTASSVTAGASTRIFVVHGHDIPALDQTELLLRRWGLDPVIVRDEANKGMTVIEKIEANSDVGYAIVLLTPDDIGRVRDGEEFPRARQNVIWEWGYLVAKLGRNRVACLRKGDVELPSDLHGIVRIDIGGDLKKHAAEIARELRAAGYRLNEE